MRIACTLLLTALAASTALATPPLLLEQDRGVYTRATTIEVGGFDEVVDPDEAADFAPFAATVGGSATTSDATARAAATIDSDLTGSSLAGDGSATASAASTAADVRSDAPADSFFEIVFEATASESVRLIGDLDASASSGEAYASVELVDVDSGTSLFDREVAAGQSDSFSEKGSLTAGTQYRLRAFALAYALSEPAPASASGDASYDVVLFIPEPPSTRGFAAGIAGLAALARAHARRRAKGTT